MCGNCIFPIKFMEKIINKTIKDFKCTDYDEGSEVTIIFTDDTKIIISYKVDNTECDFKFYKYSKEIDKWIYIGVAD